MKYLLTLLLFGFFFHYGLGQNNIKSKELNTKLELNEGYERLITYKKFKDKIVRFQRGHLRLLSPLLGELWKKEIPAKKEQGVASFSYNYKVTDDYIFVFQSWRNLDEITENIMIFRFNVEGEMLAINLKEKLNFDTYHFHHLNVINKNIYISGNLTDEKDEVKTKIVKFDSDLNLLASHQFKAKSADDQYNYKWAPYDIRAELIRFTAQFWVDSNGKILTKRKDKTNIYMSETVELNLDLKVIDTIYAPYQGTYASDDHFIFKYNADNYELRTGDSLVTKFGKSAYKNSMNKTLHLWYKGSQSTDLMNGFFSLIGDEIKIMKGHGKKLESNSFRFNLIDDPINNSVSLVLVYSNENFLLTLDKSTNVVCVKHYSVEFYKVYPTDDTYSYRGYFNHDNQLVGSMPADHKTNALDFLISNNKPGMFTIINYPDHQLLFIDNTKTKITMAYRIGQ